MRGVALDYIVHMSDDNQWILNQTYDPVEVERQARMETLVFIYILTQI